MILPISEIRDNHIAFKSGNSADKKSKYDKDTLLENNLSTRSRMGLDKLTKAFSIYPAKGIIGSKNSNFYEFLTMGTVPYLIGSAMLMSIFNSANKHFKAFAESSASKLGTKMALGVALYGVFKALSKPITTGAVKAFTGIDTELPYAKVNYLLQENPEDESNLTSIEYHKVGESVDFPRWDLLYGDPAKGEIRNFRYDKIAKKNGLGTNLNDSDQDVKPMYKEVLVKTKLATSMSSFMWAATGVALAFQKPWENYFKSATLKFWKGNEFLHSLKVFGNSFVESFKALYKGTPEKVGKGGPAGKILLGATLLTTVAGIANAVHITHKPVSNKHVINENKESVVC